MTKVLVAAHGHCFDGLCSSVIFTHLRRHIVPGEDVTFAYRTMGYGPGQHGVDPALLSGDENAILDFRFSQSQKLTWYFDHHLSAFPSEGDRVAFDNRGSDSPRRMFHDASYGSCTKYIADIGRKHFGFDPHGLRELIRWADMIDSASFPSAEMAVARAEPVLHLMTVVEHHGGDVFFESMVPRLLVESLEDIARSREIQDAYAPLAAQHQGFVDLVKAHAVVRGPVIAVDLSEGIVEVATKFVTYALWPESTYSVVLTRSDTKCKISIGYNPWSPFARKHNIAALCERYGGGGHAVVGAISLPNEDVERARQLALQLSEELAG